MISFMLIFFKLCSPWEGFVEEYWPQVGGNCKSLGANAWGFPGVNPLGWPLISALSFQNHNLEHDYQSIQILSPCSDCIHIKFSLMHALIG